MCGNYVCMCVCFVWVCHGGVVVGVGGSVQIVSSLGVGDVSTAATRGSIMKEIL